MGVKGSDSDIRQPLPGCRRSSSGCATRGTCKLAFSVVQTALVAFDVVFPWVGCPEERAVDCGFHVTDDVIKLILACILPAEELKFR